MLSAADHGSRSAASLKVTGTHTTQAERTAPTLSRGILDMPRERAQAAGSGASEAIQELRAAWFPTGADRADPRERHSKKAANEDIGDG